MFYDQWKADNGDGVYARVASYGFDPRTKRRLTRPVGNNGRILIIPPGGLKPLGYAADGRSASVREHVSQIVPGVTEVPRLRIGPRTRAKERLNLALPNPMERRP